MTSKETAILDRLITRHATAAPFCDVCGVGASLSPHHVIKRRHRSMRWLYFNIIPVCFSCHGWMEVEPAEAEKYYEQRYPEWAQMQELKEKLNHFGYAENRAMMGLTVQEVLVTYERSGL